MAGDSVYCASAEKPWDRPCAEQAQPEFVSDVTGRYRDTQGVGLSVGTRRAVAAITATTSNETMGFYHTMAVDMSDQKKIGTVVIGKNLAEAIEILNTSFWSKRYLIAMQLRRAK